MCTAVPAHLSAGRDDTRTLTIVVTFLKAILPSYMDNAELRRISDTHEELEACVLTGDHEERTPRAAVERLLQRTDAPGVGRSNTGLFGLYKTTIQTAR